MGDTSLRLFLCKMSSFLTSQLRPKQSPRKTDGFSRQRSTAAELVKIVRRVTAMDGFQFDQFLSYLNNYQLARTLLLSSKQNGAEKVRALTLYCYTLRVCLEGFQSQSVESFCCDLEGLFHQHSLY